MKNKFFQTKTNSAITFSHYKSVSCIFKIKKYKKALV